MEDAETLRLWLKSEYYPAWERLMEDAMEDARNRVLNAPVRSQDDFYAVLEDKGRYRGLKEVLGLVIQRMTQGNKARERLHGHA